ncbi:MAG: efflux RND transporter periplasmic adaptor subunit, partial [Gammaproteobacteria bacterium]|nr:efflux RND transporter periplasmic adaptor subunit [Gammaproteobacteria bacterium]
MKNIIYLAAGIISVQFLMMQTLVAAEKEVLYWVAPMDPNYQRDKPGKSPMGMDLVPVYADVASAKEKEVLYWVAPMDPNYQRDEPGKSPMGMDLVPVYADPAGGDAITISPEVIQNLGVRTSKAEISKLWRGIDTVGYVDFDESKLSHIHLRTEGWVENLAVRSEGERVKKGDRLFDFYSPQLVNAQEEFVQALSVGNTGLVSASSERLLALGISKGQIASLRKTR